MADEIKLDKDPASTFGASEEYKAAWHKKYGNVTPNASASAEQWQTWAVEKGGMSADEAEGYTRDELVDHFGGGGTVYSAPAVANEKGAPAGAGPEGNVASDPMKTPATP